MPGLHTLDSFRGPRLPAEYMGRHSADEIYDKRTGKVLTWAVKQWRERNNTAEDPPWTYAAGQSTYGIRAGVIAYRRLTRSQLLDVAQFECVVSALTNLTASVDMATSALLIHEGHEVDPYGGYWPSFKSAWRRLYKTSEPKAAEFRRDHPLTSSFLDRRQEDLLALIDYRNLFVHAWSGHGFVDPVEPIEQFIARTHDARIGAAYLLTSGSEEISGQ